MTEPEPELNPILALDEDDHVHGFWYGSAISASIMATLFRRDGQMRVVGRIRAHVDDKLFDSDDPKFRFEFSARPDAKLQMFKRRAKQRIRTFWLERITTLKFVRVEGDMLAMARAYEKLAEKDSNFRLRIKKYDRPDPGPGPA